MKKCLLCLLFVVLFTYPALEGSAVTAPTISRQPMNLATLVNTMAEFSVTATGTEPLRYQWQNSPSDDGIWSDIAEANSADYAFIATTNDYIPFYRVVVSNDYGSAMSDRTMFNIIPPIPPMPSMLIDKQPEGNTEVTEGSITGSLLVVAYIDPYVTITYQWYLSTTNSYIDGTLIRGATSASFTIPKTLTASGSPYYYYCVLHGTYTGPNSDSDMDTYIEHTQIAMITVNNPNNPNSSNGSGCNGILAGGGMSEILIILSIIWSCIVLGGSNKNKQKYN